MERAFSLIENYIYLHHTDTFIILPVFPESVTDSNQANFAQAAPLARSAPIYSYSGSGPRSVNFTLNLHRDLMQQVNYNRSNVKVKLGDDYVDTIIKQLQACVIPSYRAVSKMVDPPMVSVRIGDDIFIKGVVTGSIQTTMSGPLIVDVNNRDGNPRYAQVSIGLSISEIDPYSAETVMQMGCFRGLTSRLESGLYDRTYLG